MRTSPQSLNLVDLALTEPAAAAILLAALEQDSALITCLNEPEETVPR